MSEGGGRGAEDGVLLYCRRQCCGNWSLLLWLLRGFAGVAVLVVLTLAPLVGVVRAGGGMHTPHGRLLFVAI